MSLRVLNNEAGFDPKQDDPGFSVICNIPSLGLSCFGCCGHHFKDKETMQRFFDENEAELKKYLGEGKSYEAFMNREHLLDPCGGCYSLMRETDAAGREQYYCGVHPFRIGKEIRVGYCDHDYLCKTAAHVQRMTPEEKALFYDFLKDAKFNSFTYSIINSEETMLLELFRTWKAERKKRTSSA